VTGNAYRQERGERLSSNLKEATEKLASSSLARELLGSAFVEHFVNTRFWEWRRFEQATTDWELKRYFELA
jgi:glutamine synthetase